MKGKFEDKLRNWTLVFKILVLILLVILILVALFGGNTVVLDSEMVNL